MKIVRVERLIERADFPRLKNGNQSKARLLARYNPFNGHPIQGLSRFGTSRARNAAKAAESSR